jgi:Na+/proline symporter
MRDIYQRFMKKDANPKNMVALQKVFIVALGVVAFLLATQLTSVLQMSLFAYTIYGVAITPALLAALAWKRATKAGGLASIIAGTVVCLVFFGLSKIPGIPAPDGDPWGIPLIYPALIASLGALVIVSLLTPKPKPEELEKFFPKKAGAEGEDSCPGPVEP